MTMVARAKHVYVKENVPLDWGRRTSARKKQIHIGDGTLVTSLFAARDGFHPVCVDPSPLGEVLLNRILLHLQGNAPREKLDVSSFFLRLSARSPLYRNRYPAIFQMIEGEQLGYSRVNDVFNSAIGSMTAKILQERIRIARSKFETSPIKPQSAESVTYYYPAPSLWNEEHFSKLVAFAARTLVNCTGTLKFATESDYAFGLFKKVLGKNNFFITHEDDEHYEDPKKPSSLYGVLKLRPYSNYLVARKDR